MNRTVVLTHREFAEAAEEIATRTGRSVGDVAAGLAGNVVVKEAEASLEHVDVRGYAHALAQFTAEHGCAVSAALAHVRPEDFARGVR
ncbi:MAG TPA: hypothetical protein PLP50_15670 [Thermoanaerobaculia bacterium]|nr:hypothetical protein [Thermoanaerobaculia bacterium]HQN09380.1 hypothetical protein [Thermoanaerobaculia bacterium]HQP88639.1 hypothetical protein [Thermoanaerobaculia bacterium]